MKDCSFHPVAWMRERAVLFSYAGSVCAKLKECALNVWVLPFSHDRKKKKPGCVLAVMMFAPTWQLSYAEVTTRWHQWHTLHGSRSFRASSNLVQSVSKCVALCVVQCVGEGCFFFCFSRIYQASELYTVATYMNEAGRLGDKFYIILFDIVFIK